MERIQPEGETKAEIRANAKKRGYEARHSGKKKKWYFHRFATLKMIS